MFALFAWIEEQTIHGLAGVVTFFAVNVWENF